MKKAKSLSEEDLQIAEKRRGAKGKGQKEEQGEIRKPCSVINTKKQKKTTELERLERSLRKSEISREYFMQR